MSNKRRNNQIINLTDQTDVLSNNIVDKDVQSMFLPFTLMQTILLSPKYRINNNIISPNNLFNKCLLLCGTLICMSAYFYRLFNMENFSDSKVVIYAASYDFCYHVCGFFADFVINLVETKTSVLFILTIQEVHRCLNNEHSFKRYIKISWIIITVTICYYIIICVSNYIVNNNFQIHIIVSVAVLIHFDMNIVYAIRLKKLLQDKILEWNYQALHTLNDTQNAACRHILFRTYLQILQCHQLYNDIFHQMVLYITIQCFLHSLLFIKLIIEFSQLPYGSKENYSALILSVFLSIWMLKNFLLQTALTLYCEAFYMAVEDSQDTCAYILLSNCTDEDKKLCKNVRRAYRASFSKMRACRLFYVDVCLLLHLAALLTNYTFVLLQFAFL